MKQILFTVPPWLHKLLCVTADNVTAVMRTWRPNAQSAGISKAQVVTQWAPAEHTLPA